MRDQENISPIDQYLIDFVRQLRSEKKLTQDDVGNIIGISRSYISDIESLNSRAKYNLRHINSLADYFNMSPRDFLPEKALPYDFKANENIKKKIGNKKFIPTNKNKKGKSK